MVPMPLVPQRLILLATSTTVPVATTKTMLVVALQLQCLLVAITTITTTTTTMVISNDLVQAVDTTVGIMVIITILSRVIGFRLVELSQEQGDKMHHCLRDLDTNMCELHQPSQSGHQLSMVSMATMKEMELCKTSVTFVAC